MAASVAADENGWGVTVRVSTREPSYPARWIPGLDGLRAIAVAAVVAFHLSSGYLPGGFLGVDLFFVISGYLITRLLLAERERTGRIALGRFYLRRARRLLPAVALLLGVVAIAGGLIWTDQRPTLGGSLASSAGYVTNWWLIADQQSYFVATGRPPMLQHLWSLAVEEQYYLAWAPAVMLLGGAWWLGRRATRDSAPGAIALRVAALAGGLTLASTLAMAIIAIETDVPYQTDSARVYFGTDTHAMGLLLGSAVGALTIWARERRTRLRRVGPQRAGGMAAGPTADLGGIAAENLATDTARMPVWASDLLAVAGLAGVAWFFWTVDEFEPWLYRGGFLIFSALAVMAVVGAARAGGRLGRLLDVPPLRWLGQRSYGIYLWHWPIAVVTRPVIDIVGPTWLLNPARAGLAVALAAVSYRYLEQPVRQGRFLAGMRDGTRQTLARWRAAGGWRTVVQRRWAAPAVALGCAAVLIVGYASAQSAPLHADSAAGQSDEPWLWGSEDPGPDTQDDAALDQYIEGGPGGAGTGGGAVDPGSGGGEAADPDSAAGHTAGGSDPVPPGMTESSSQTPSTSPSPDPGTGHSTGTTPADIAPADTGATTVETTTSASAPAPHTAPAESPPAKKATPKSTAPKTTTPKSTTPTSTAPKPPARKTTTPQKTAPKKAAVSAFGDSVLLGAAPALKAEVGPVALDAVVGRQSWDTLSDVQAAQEAGKLAPIVLIHTGNNGIIPPKQLAATLKSLKDRDLVILLNDHVDRSWAPPNNKTIAAVRGKYGNVVILDWNAAANANPSWFGPDGMHVNGSGARAYAKLVARAMA